MQEEGHEMDDKLDELLEGMSVLSDEQLEAVSGGAWNDWDDCEKVEYGGTGGCPGGRY